MPISSSNPFKPTQKLFLNEKDVKTLWQILLGNPAISSFVGCFKATLINAGMLEMISVMRNQKPLFHCSVNNRTLCYSLLPCWCRAWTWAIWFVLPRYLRAKSKICTCCNWWRWVWTKVLWFILLCWFKALHFHLSWHIYFKFCWKCISICFTRRVKVWKLKICFR